MKFLNLKAAILLSLFFAYAASAAFYPINKGMIIQATVVTTAAGTTTFDATGNQAYIFEGATTQTARFPSAILLPIDWWYKLTNNSTGAVTVQDGSGATIATLAASQIGEFVLKARATSAGTWKQAIYPALNSAGDISGNALTADALSANPTDCASGQYAYQIDASGNLTCNQVSVATALASNPTDCAANEYASGIDASGNLTCSAPPGGGDVTGPSSSTDNAIARFDGTTGKTIQNSGTSIDDSGNMTASSFTGPLIGNVTGNLTGNADTVTTNADLTGPITSSANVTFVGAQTGTGSTFVMNTSPTLVTPVLGVASATSISAANGDVTTPSFYTATGSGNTGFYFGANGAAFAYNNAEIAYFTGSAWAFDVQVQLRLNGSASTPGMTMESDANTGFYGGGDGQWFWSSNGVKALDFSEGGLIVTGTVSGSSMTASTFTGALSGNASTASALAANPSDCSANQFASAIAADGDLTCAQPAFTDLSGAVTVTQSTLANVALTTCTTARTIDWRQSNSFTLLLTDANECAVTFSNPTSGQVITVDYTQGAGTGNATLTHSSTVLWSGGTPPTITTGSSATDSCTYKWNGTDYRGSCVQDMSAP